MSSVFVTNDLVALSLTDEELLSRSPDGVITNVDARRIIRRELELAGFEPWPFVEIELFMGSDAMLIMARPARAVHCFAFESFEDLLSTALHGADCDSCLVFYAGKYSLIVNVGQRELPPALFEFGEHIGASNHLSAHIIEHGEVIIAKNALGALRDKFHPA